MAQRKYQRMTRREKEARAQVKKELQEKGFLPPDKPRLNRKKFVREAIQEYDTLLQGYDSVYYLNRAISVFLSDVKFTPEHIGVAKVLKIAVGTKEYMNGLKEQGKTTYNVKDYYDTVVDPILRL